MAQEWDIKARGELCSECTMPFQDRQQYFSALVYGEEGYVRQDFCGRCWMGGKKDATASYSQWQGIFRPPPPPPVEALKKETAESLLRRLIEQDDVTKVNVMYILAIMLERKRILVEKDIQKREDGTKVIVYEHKKTGEVFLIPDPGLQLDQLEHVQIEVVDMLGRHDAAQIPGTETVDPAAPATATDGQAAPVETITGGEAAVPQDTPKTEEIAEVKPVEPEIQGEQHEPAEQTVPEESKSVPEPREEKAISKALKGKKKKTLKSETPAEPVPEVKSETPEPKPGKATKAKKEPKQEKSPEADEGKNKALEPSEKTAPKSSKKKKK